MASRRGAARVLTDSEDNNEEEDIELKDLYKFMKKMKTELYQKMTDCTEELKEKVELHSGAITKLQESTTTAINDINKIKADMNDKEQRSRNYSIRIFNLPVVSTVPSKPPSPMQVLNHAYETLIKPVLSISVAKGEIPSVPPCLDVLEFGHILPLSNKSTSQVPPIIIRFFSRSYRTLFMMNKKGVLLELNKSNVGQATGVFEDLTATNFRRRQEISQDPLVEKAFTLNGQIKYFLKSNPAKMRTLKSPFDAIEST